MAARVLISINQTSLAKKLATRSQKENKRRKRAQDGKFKVHMNDQIKGTAYSATHTIPATSACTMYMYSVTA